MSELRQMMSSRVRPRRDCQGTGTKSRAMRMHGDGQEPQLQRWMHRRMETGEA